MVSTEQSHAVPISAAGHGGWMEGPAEAVQGVTVTLRDGTPLVIRPVNSEDRPAIAALFARLSPQSLYTRFHASTVHISDAVLDLVTADHALVAELEGQIIALASYHPLHDPTQAEMAMVVDDRHQGRGIGTALFGVLSFDAQQAGIRRLRAGVLRSNGAMLRVFQQSPFPLTHRSSLDEIEVEVDLLPAAA